MPAETANSEPPLEEMVAMAVEALLQVPPSVVQLSRVVAAGHADNVPVMDAGGELTVTTRVTAQPVVLV